MHTMASDIATVMDASDDETVLAAEHGEYSLVVRCDFSQQVKIRRHRVRDVDTQVVPEEFTRWLVENDMLKLWESMQPLNASELLIELRGRAGDCGYDRAKLARQIIWQLKADEEKAEEAEREDESEASDIPYARQIMRQLKADEETAGEAEREDEAVASDIPLPRPPQPSTHYQSILDKWIIHLRGRMPRARDDVIEAIAARKAEEEITAGMTSDERRLIDGEDDSRTIQPQITPAPPAKKASPKKAVGNFTGEEGAWEDEHAEDADYWGAGEPRKPQVERRTEKRIRDDDQSQNEKKEKKKRKKKQRK